MRFCDAFDIPVLSLTNVTGYEATIASEKLLTREAARMTAAFAEASVPKINFITKEAYGSLCTDEQQGSGRGSRVRL